MARNPYGSLGDAYDTSIAFDYNLEADQVKRRRQIAELLRAQSMDTGSDGRFISNSAGTWFVPGADSGIAGGISKLAKALLSRNMESKADARDKELSEFAEQRYEARLDQLEQARRDREAAAIADAESQQTDGSTPTVTVIPDNTRRTLAAMLKEGGLSANYAGQRLAAMDALPTPVELQFRDGYVFNPRTGATQQVVDPKLETQVVESDGRKKLVNAQTGETIRDLGSSLDPKAATEMSDAAQAKRDSAYESMRHLESIRDDFDRIKNPTDGYSTDQLRGLYDQTLGKIMPGSGRQVIEGRINSVLLKAGKYLQALDRMAKVTTGGENNAVAEMMLNLQSKLGAVAQMDENGNFKLNNGLPNTEIIRYLDAIDAEMAEQHERLRRNYGGDTYTPPSQRSAGQPAKSYGGLVTPGGQ